MPHRLPHPDGTGQGVSKTFGFSEIKVLMSPKDGTEGCLQRAFPFDFSNM